MTSVEYSSARYARALDAYLAGAGETALTEAYELGRRLLTEGFGLLDLADLHQRVLRAWYEHHDTADVAMTLRGAATFFAEILSAFDMHFLRIDESTAAWKRVNDSLESEMKRISLALHGEAGNILAQATLQMDLASRSVPTELRSRLAVVRRLLEETGERLRHFSHALRPSVLDDFGLATALTCLAESVERRTGIRVRVQANVDRSLEPRIERTVYRVAQEAINNALRHGGEAPTIDISVEMQENSVRCVVADDGDGFDVVDVLENNSRPGLGLLGMRERAAVLGGECRVSSRPGGGTRVDLMLPL